MILRVPEKAINARLEDDWSEVTRCEEPNPWMMANMEESCSPARQEDDQRKSTAQQKHLSENVRKVIY